jgi:type IV pilus assembly protein PilA
MLAAIAIPSLLRARVSANESAAIGDIRTIISAQVAYQAANGGWFESNLECLAAPSVGCIPGYAAGDPAFLDSVLASRQPKSGYARRFEPGRIMAVDPAVSSSTSVASFAYVAVPLAAGQTGVRSFCGDSSGVICFRADGADIPALGGECPVASRDCTPFQ